MRVAYPMRVDALDKVGGDVLQIQHYITAAGALDEGFSGEIVVDLRDDLTRFDLIHLTNIDRPVELHHFSERAHAQGKPIVISPIHHSYREIEAFEQTARSGLAGMVSRHLSFELLELLRSILRMYKYPGLLGPVIRLACTGTRQAQLAALQAAERILLLARKEHADIVKDIGAVDRAKVTVLRNGFNPVSAIGPVERDVEVCIVGRIEARKNQLAILDVLENLGLAGVFVGKENPYHARYCSQFKNRIAGSRSTYINGLSPQETLAMMQRSKVHVSASWFEVSSLVDIEAFFSGCSVVSSANGGTREILGEHATYVHPASASDIQAGIVRAFTVANSSRVTDLAERCLLPSWAAVGRVLLAVYREVLDHHSRN